MKEYTIDKEKCVSCGACANVCPHQAIKFDNEQKAYIDQTKCKKCGNCLAICSFEAIKQE